MRIMTRLNEIAHNQYGQLKYLRLRTQYPHEFFANVRHNKQFYNIHAGSRCFIIGNGPSLNSQDLSMLKGEIIFSVNQASRNPKIMELNPQYHFWVDPVFFNLDSNKPSDMDVLRCYKDIYSGTHRPVTFLPQQAYRFVKQYRLDEEIDIQFFVKKIIVAKDGYLRPFDFSRSVPNFGTVVQYCLAMAFYMGFSEIYLLGCDTTGIITIIDGAVKGSNAQYSYEITENEKERMHEIYSNEEYLMSSIRGFADILDTYRMFNTYAKHYGVKLYNCSAKTIIQSIPRKHLESLF